MRTYYLGIFLIAIILPLLITAQGRANKPDSQQEELISAMRGFERQIRRFYQSQVGNIEANALKQNLDNQTLIPCSKIEKAAKNLENNVTSVVQVENVLNWLTSLEDCMVSVLRKITSLKTADIGDRVTIVEHTLGRYGIITIGPRFGGQTEELLGRIFRLERQVFNNKEDDVNHVQLDDQLRQRLEKQEAEIKLLKEMMSNMSGNAVDLVTVKPIPTVKPGVSTLTINELVDKVKKRSALHVAAEQGDVARLTDLLMKGANTDLQDFKMWTPLHLAAWKGHEELVRLLLDYNAKIEARDQFNYTALHWAAQYGNVASVKILLEKGANMEARDNNGETPLHKAAWDARASAMETLLNKGANHNALRKEGYTPLHLAILRNCVPCVKNLLTHGVDLSIKTEQGEDAESLARDGRNSEIIKLLEEAQSVLDIFNSK